ncbi:MAG TPA: phosphoglycolate phosphatase [Methylotenera sp.]|nr:phosphoglycolate phosphatase [Methylotenera sp.]
MNKSLKKFNINAVMLDLDGTLIHTAPEIARATNHMLKRMSMPVLEPAQVQAYIGEGAVMLIKRCLTGKLDSEPDAALMAKAQPLFFEAYAEIVAESLPYDGIAEALQAIKNTGVKLACITNKPAAFTEPLLEKSGLAPYFDLIVSGDTLQKKKPEPDQIFHICEKFGISPQQAVLIGDSKTDIEAARNAGCYVFTVPYGYNQGYSIEIDAVDALINHISETVQFISTDLAQTKFCKNE